MSLELVLFGIFIVYFRKSIIQDNIFLEIGYIAFSFS